MANRSLVVREAILRLQAELEGKTPQQSIATSMPGRGRGLTMPLTSHQRADITQKIADRKDPLPLSKQLFTSLPKEKEIRDFEAEKRKKSQLLR